MDEQKLKIQKFKQGFTLAEVLITLVIIGVIAALTIPTAINNTKEQELKSQFAKAYSTISQALYKTEMNDFYGYARCYYPYNLETNVTQQYIPDDCVKFFNAFEKYLSVQKICKGNALSDGCIPKYKTYFSGWYGYSENNINNVNYVYVLANGQIIIYYDIGALPLFLVDINGMKGPNDYGFDLFSFAIKKHDYSGMYIGGDLDFPVRSSGSKTTNQMIEYSLAGKK